MGYIFIYEVRCVQGLVFFVFCFFIQKRKKRAIMEGLSMVAECDFREARQGCLYECMRVG